MADSELLNGKDQDEWNCKACGQAIWARSRRRQCFLCARYFHSGCRKARVVLIKPSIDVDKVGMEVKCCVECALNHKSLKKFAAFRESFDHKRKIVVFYDLYKKLRQSISDSMHSFGLFVISFVENNNLASKERYLECRNCHATLTGLFQSLTKLMKKLMESKFRNQTDDKVAKYLKMCISEWIQESLAQLRALEISWKKIKIEEVKLKKKNDVVLKKERSFKLAVSSISPIVSPLKGTNISIVGANFSREMEVFVENIKCEFAFISPASILIQSPEIMIEGPKDLKIKTLESEVLLPAILMYNKLPSDDVILPAPTPSRSSGSSEGGGRSRSNSKSAEETSKHSRNSSTASNRYYHSRSSSNNSMFDDKMFDFDEGDDDHQTLIEQVEDSDDGGKLTIVSLDPVVSPMNGTMVELMGSNIEEDCSVLIDGVYCDFVDFMPSNGRLQRICFLSPRLLEPGFKTVQVQNASEKAQLANVLQYVESE
jgi:hypothetical protein